MPSSGRPPDSSHATSGARSRPAGSLTDVPGIRVGHARVAGGGSGCTVILGPFRGAVSVDGFATGTRELPTLDPRHVVPRITAVLFTGGSAFGLSAADGVMAWLEEQGLGHETGAARVPIVPSAVLYDLAPGRVRPGTEEGWAACEQASEEPVKEGRVGAGSGATVGKALGLERSCPGGVGSASVEAGGWRVGALAVVNAVGDVRGLDDRIVAGARDDDGGFRDADAVLRGVSQAAVVDPLQDPGVGRNTTLALVATDAPASKVDLSRIAKMAAAALARRITPVHTPFDGDVTFALSTSAEEGSLNSREVLALGVAARAALETSVIRAVTRNEAVS